MSRKVNIDDIKFIDEEIKRTTDLNDIYWDKFSENKKLMFLFLTLPVIVLFCYTNLSLVNFVASFVLTVLVAFIFFVRYKRAESDYLGNKMFISALYEFKKIEMGKLYT
jgi:hypothetical protein